MRTVILAAALLVSAPLSAQVVIESVEPRSGVIAGGTTVTISGRNFGALSICPILCPNVPSATVGSRPAAITSLDDDALVLVTPPGTTTDPVDITITGVTGFGTEIRSAFTYVANPAQPARLLVPVNISFPFAGAHGSQWTSELWLRNSGTKPFQVTYARVCEFPGQPYVCSGVADMIPAKSVSFSNGAVHTIPGSGRTEVPGPTSPFLLVPRNRLGALSAHLRVQDLSRASMTFGTELPLVSEDDFRFSTIDLVNVPTDPAFRVSLRIYDAASVPMLYRVDVINDNGVVVRQLQLTPRFWLSRSMPESAAVAEAHDLVDALSGRATVRVSSLATGSASVSPFWAFITVTHRETQHVTTITPQ